MPIKSVFWDGNGGYDIHLLPRDKSRRLDQLLVVEDDSGYHFANSLPGGSGIRVSFFGEYNGAPTAHGIAIDVATGQVSVADPLPAPPAPRLRNFLIRAEASDSSGTFVAKPRIRVHVHDALVGAWLTPDPLWIHLGADGEQFSILAEFDDGTIGDITRLPSVQWKSDKPGIGADSFDGALTAHSPNVVDATISATLPPVWGGRTISAKCNSLPSWSTPRAATFIDGPGPAAMGSARNFLFLPDGFGHADRAAFTVAVLDLVKALRNDQATSPFDLMKEKINYWSAWIESPEQGCTVLNECSVDSSGIGYAVPPASEPSPAPPGQPRFWSLSEMFHEVGLPIHSDAIPAGASPDDIANRLFAKQDEWEVLYGKEASDGVTVDVFQQWCGYADRRLVNEQNTAIGIAVGGRPNYQNPSLPPGASWNPLRTTREHLDGMLSALTNGDGGPKVGATWGDAKGKDRIFVYALLGGTCYAANSSGNLVAVSLRTQENVLVQPSAGRAMAITPYPVPAKIPPAVSWTVAHETGHVFGLGDEYAAVGTLAAAAMPGIAPVPNLQDQASLLSPTPPPPPPQVQGLDGGKLKWLWPRIAKAGLLRAAPTAQAGGTVRLSLEVGHEVPFHADPNDGDEAVLRLRPLTPNAPPSQPLKVVSKAPGELIVQPAGAGSSPLGFPAGSIVYVPVRNDSTGTPLLLVSDKVRDHITQSGQPLNAPAGSPKARTCDAQHPYSGYQAGSNLPPGLKLPPALHSGAVLGAYEGGRGFQCGIYHPAGMCMMSENRGDQTSGTRYFDLSDPRIDYWVRDKAYPFCPVCRYVLVDAIDPSKHGELEAWYAPQYPG